MARRSNSLSLEELQITAKPVIDREISFDDAMTVFTDDAKRKGLREFTIVYYQRELNSFRKFLFANDKPLKVSGVVRGDVNEFVELLQRKGRKPATINAKLRAIRAFFNFLADGKYIDSSPMEKYPLVRDRKANIETFTLNQLRDLLNAPDRRTFIGQRDYTFILLLLETGIRLNEASGILVEDVKLSEGLLFIRKTKNHFHRYVPIQAKMREQLKRYIQLRGTCECDHLFVTLDGTPASRGTLLHLIPDYGKQAGITGVRCSAHTMRHTFAKMSIMNGAGVFELQRILGHSTMEMVKTYVNLYSTDVFEKHKKFSPLKDL
ncbi:tyrosine-type recombinase/integrase [Rummeliibacillus suwonensis]|uniref:tyrosine-type recombinase/integrase n=1 Tax=Rummeliibacillus suwonensis TaxID=1306154 RepID=UPI0011B65D2D|nr:tyrosine-type recombinase/integrase [Rummeliibacillus suwonensis]